jgi:hypothetical protein
MRWVHCSPPLGLIALPLRRREGRKIIPAYSEAWWRSGYAEDCKSLHPGSIPGQASIFLIDSRQTWRHGRPSPVRLPAALSYA